MARRRNKPINVPAPYLRRVWLDPARIADRKGYPFCLPLLHDDFEIVMFEGSNPLRYAWYMAGVGLKQAQRMRGVHTVRAGQIEFSGDAHLQIDGEYAGRMPGRFEIVPDALTILAPSLYR